MLIQSRAKFPTIPVIKNILLRKILSAIAGLYVCSSIAVDAPSANAENRKLVLIPPRTLHFPKKGSYGVLEITPLGGNQITVKKIARGMVAIAPNHLVVYKPNMEFFKNPEIINGLAPDSLEAIVLQLLSVDDDEDKLGDRALKEISKLSQLKCLNLDRLEVTDEGLRYISKLQQLQSVSAFLTPGEGSIIKYCAPLKHLRSLNCNSITLKDQYLKYLPNYKALRVLKASHSSLQNSGIAFIANCPDLEELVIKSNNKVTDVGLSGLKSLSKLENLDVSDTAVTIKGLEHLRHLKLKKLIISKKSFSNTDLQKLKSYFPLAEIDTKVETHLVDEDTRTLFGQLSRQRKF